MPEQKKKKYSKLSVLSFVTSIYFWIAFIVLGVSINYFNGASMPFLVLIEYSVLVITLSLALITSTIGSITSFYFIKKYGLRGEIYSRTSLFLCLLFIAMGFESMLDASDLVFYTTVIICLLISIFVFRKKKISPAIKKEKKKVTIKTRSRKRIR